MEEKDFELAVIQQGDQYFLPFKITADGTEITPDDVDSLIIKVGGSVNIYPNGELQYDNEWLFPLEREITLHWGSKVSCQASYKKDNEIRSTRVYTVRVNNSIITEDF